MFIDYASATIAMTKKEMKAAGKYGSDEYKNLLEARHENPDFKIVTIERKAARVSRDTYKGLTYSYMENYISSHDSDGTIMAEYKKNRCQCDDPSDNLPEAYGFQEMKKWFLEQYAEIADFYSRKRTA